MRFLNKIITIKDRNALFQSFSDKIASLMARPGQDPVPKDDVPWWLRYAGRGVGTVGGIGKYEPKCDFFTVNSIVFIVAIFLGVFNCTSILLGGVMCLLAGLWQIVASFVVVCCEAPCCCMFVDYVQNLSDWVEKRPYWNRAVAYVW